MKDYCKLLFNKKLNISNIFLVSICTFFICSANVEAMIKTNVINRHQARVISTINWAKDYIKKNGREKAIIEFTKNSHDIFMADYSGVFFVSPLHPELVRSSQLNYKDSSGTLVVQQEIEKAKAGGGWLKGRWRKDSQTGKYICRKIYIHPMLGNYLIGSWYHYSPQKLRVCSF